MAPENNHKTIRNLRVELKKVWKHRTKFSFDHGTLQKNFDIYPKQSNVAITIGCSVYAEKGLYTLYLKNHITKSLIEKANYFKGELRYFKNELELKVELLRICTAITNDFEANNNVQLLKIPFV